MKSAYIVTLILLSACKQYQPKETVQSSLGSLATLNGSDCKNKDLIYVTSDPSTIGWTIGQTKGAATPITSKNPASGKVTLAKGALNQMKGLISFNVIATSTGDPIRDRVFQEVLLGLSNSSPFRFNLQTLSGASAIANGQTIDMKAEGVLELGERKAPLSMPIKVTEKDGVYSLDGTVSIDARQSRPAVNSVDLDDKFKLIETALSTTLGSSIDLSINFKLKNNCLAK